MVRFGVKKTGFKPVNLVYVRVWPLITGSLSVDIFLASGL